MRSPATLSTLLRSPFMARLTGALCLLTSVVLIGTGGFLPKPLGPEQGHAEVVPTVEPVPIAQSAPPAVVAPAPPAPRQATALPTAQQPAAPVEAPVPPADLQATPPPPDPNLPSWAVNSGEASLWSGPVGGTLFTKIPAGATFRVMERQATRYRVFYPGDRAKRQPGEAWVDVAELAASPWPHWVRLRGPSTIRTLPVTDGAAMVALKPGDIAEVVGQSGGSWARVFELGDGRKAPVEGWLDVGAVAPIPGPDVISTFALSRDLFASGTLETWLKVPYRSQLDGSVYAAANCGPTTAGMVLESFGYKVAPLALRQEVLSLQPAEDCDDCGTYIQNLAEVIARRGLKITGLRDADKPTDFHHWTPDEIRTELRAGHPVMAQVFYRGLPPRANSGYWGDHFIVLTGITGDRFVFNDPIDVEGPGYSRLITAEALDFAMSQSDFPYAGFSIGK